MSTNSITHSNLLDQRQLQLPHPDHPEEAHTDVVYRIYLQDNYLVSVSADHTVRIWDLRTRRLLHPPLTGHTGSVIAVHFDPAPQSDLIITGDTHGNIITWRFSTGEKIKTITEAHDETVLSLHFNQRYLATGGKDTKIKLWNRHALDINHTDVPSYAVGPSAGDDAEYPAYTLLATFSGHHAAVNAVHLKDDVLVSGSGDWRICIWCLWTGEKLQEIKIHEMGIACLQYNGRFIVSGSTDNTIRIYGARERVEVACLRGHGNVVRSVQSLFSDEDNVGSVEMIVSGSYDGSIRVWEPVPGSQSREWRTRQELSLDGFVADADVQRGGEGREFGNRIFSVDLDGKRLVCAGQGPVIRVWELAGPRER